MENNEDLFEDLEFKALSKGLGFHHSVKEKKQVKTQMGQIAKQQESLKQSLLKAEIEKEHKREKSVDMGDLTPFYTEPKRENPVVQVERSLTRNVVNIEAPMSIRFMSWLIDFSFISFALSSTFAAIFYTADIPLELINSIMIDESLPISFGVLYLMCYIFYFSFFEKTNFSTPGKRILGLKVIATKGKMSIVKSFSRVLISIISMPILALPLVLKTHDELTSTKVIKSNG